jgi:hypothetical protein
MSTKLPRRADVLDPMSAGVFVRTELVGSHKTERTLRRLSSMQPRRNLPRQLIVKYGHKYDEDEEAPRGS